MKPRFSLLFLTLSSLFLGTLMLVWTRRDAWVLEKVEPILPTPFYNLTYPKEKLTRVTPDQTRAIESRLGREITDGRRWIRCCERKTPIDARALGSEYAIYAENFGSLLFHFKFLPVQAEVITFIDNDHLLFWSPSPDETSANPKVDIYHVTRRFPEWWWGHFYRPEVWLAAVLAIGLSCEAYRVKRLKYELQT